MKNYVLNSHLNNFTIVGTLFENIRYFQNYKVRREYGEMIVITKYVDEIAVKILIPDEILHSSMCNIQKGDYVQVVGMIKTYMKGLNQVGVSLVAADIKLLKKSNFINIHSDNFKNVVRTFDKGTKKRWNSNVKTAKKGH